MPALRRMGPFLTGRVPIGRSDHDVAPVVPWGVTQPRSTPASPSQGAWSSRPGGHVVVVDPTPPGRAPATRSIASSGGGDGGEARKLSLAELMKTARCRKSGELGHWAREHHHKEHAVGMTWWDGDRGPGHDSLATLDALAITELAGDRRRAVDQSPAQKLWNSALVTPDPSRTGPTGTPTWGISSWTSGASGVAESGGRRVPPAALCAGTKSQLVFEVTLVGHPALLVFSVVPHSCPPGSRSKGARGSVCASTPPDTPSTWAGCGVVTSPSSGRQAGITCGTPVQPDRHRLHPSARAAVDRPSARRRSRCFRCSGHPFSYRISLAWPMPVADGPRTRYALAQTMGRRSSSPAPSQRR